MKREPGSVDRPRRSSLNLKSEDGKGGTVQRNELSRREVQDVVTLSKAGGSWRWNKRARIVRECSLLLVASVAPSGVLQERRPRFTRRRRGITGMVKSISAVNASPRLRREGFPQLPAGMCSRVTMSTGAIATIATGNTYLQRRVAELERGSAVCIGDAAHALEYVGMAVPTRRQLGTVAIIGTIRAHPVRACAKRSAWT